MRNRVTYKPAKKEVSAVKLDVVPKPEKDDPEEPSNFERNPGFSKFASKKTFKNVPVKFVKSKSGQTETFEIKNVSIEILPEIEVDQPDVDETNKRWDRHPGQASMVVQRNVQAQPRPRPQVKQPKEVKAVAPVARPNPPKRVQQFPVQSPDCAPCKRKQRPPQGQVKAVALDVQPKIQKDQAQVVKKWDRFPNGHPMKVAEMRRMAQRNSGVSEKNLNAPRARLPPGPGINRQRQVR